MIRINLLRPRTRSEGGLMSFLRPPGRSAFISGREVLAGVVLLAAGASMLQLHYGLFGPGAGEQEASESVAASTEQSRDSLQPGGQAEPGGAEASEESSPIPSGESSALDPNSGELSPASHSSAKQGVSSPPNQPAAAEKPSKKAGSTVAAVAPPGAAKLTEMQISTRNGALRLSLITGERATYKMFRLDNPNRVVVDVPGVRLALPVEQQRLEISHPLVHRIRIGQYRAYPPVTRLVLDVAGFPDLLLFPHSAGLDIQVSNTSQ